MENRRSEGEQGGGDRKERRGKEKEVEGRRRCRKEDKMERKMKDDPGTGVRKKRLRKHRGIRNVKEERTKMKRQKIDKCRKGGEK
jgi:hypothetical protein